MPLAGAYLNLRIDTGRVKERSSNRRGGSLRGQRESARIPTIVIPSTEQKPTDFSEFVISFFRFGGGAMKKFYVVFAACAFLVLAFTQAAPSWQAQVELVRKSGKIPKNFKTYSLFLVCNPRWLAPEKSEDLYGLYQEFQSFGRTIGDDNAAVWFWKTERSAHDPALAENVDVERSVRFCQAWKLTPSEGPHLVITSVYPDESHLSSGLPKGGAVYSLGNMTPKDISSLLAKLTDELIQKGRVEGPPATTAAVATPLALWVRLLDATQRIINSFGCAWTFKIDAGPVNADLHACKAE